MRDGPLAAAPQHSALVSSTPLHPAVLSSVAPSALALAAVMVSMFRNRRSCMTLL